jgi:hypothetical protein
MREYIERLARGSYIYRRQKLNTGAEHISGTVTEGTCCQYGLTLTAQNAVKGIVYSDNEHISFECNMFNSANAELVYTVDAQRLKAGSKIEGHFYIASDAGEYTIGYEFAVEEETVTTSLGNSHTMFDFANLVQASPEEAATVFLSPSFKKVFLKNDISLINIYDAVRHSTDVNEAMEEFLIAVKKKTPVTVSISHEERRYSHIAESRKDSVTIHRSCWGYIAMDISTDAPFIELKDTHITSEKFTGNNYEFEYIIHTDLLHAGKNYAVITFDTFGQRLQLSIEIESGERQDLSSAKRDAGYELTKEYLLFRMKKQDKVSWQENSNRILTRIRADFGEDVFFKLAQAQVYATLNRSEDAQWLVESVQTDIEDIQKNDVELYCYFLYVSALVYKDDAYTRRAVKRISAYYENGYDTWKILWILFFIDESQDKNKSIKLMRIKDTFHNGCTSPVMYFEAMQIMNSNPELLRVLNDFEIQVLLFGCKNELVTTKLALHICELVSNEKIAGMHLLKLLNALNDYFDNDEILTVLVTHMIRNELVGTQYVKLYEKGILRGLRITRLYEFYLESHDKKTKKRLPQIVVRYFAYESRLSTEAKAYLYANIITNISSSRETMNVYEPQIERFAYEQMRLGHIDDNLAVIYEYLFKNIIVNEETASFLSRYLFTYKITVFEDDISSVIVKHKELRRGQRYQIVNNTAYVQMYTKDCVFMFEDKDKVVRKGSLHYEIERIYDNEEFILPVCSLCSGDLYIRLYLYTRGIDEHRADEDMKELCILLMDNGNVNQETRNDMNAWLIRYYKDFYTGDDFRQCLPQIRKEIPDTKTASELIETCIYYGCYEDAFDFVCMYGMENVSAARLLLMASSYISLHPDEYNEKLLQCCVRAFIGGKYNETVLAYLLKYYNSSNVKMLKLWRACIGFKVPAVSLSERIIVQMLFTGSGGERIYEVFAYYYKNGNDCRVVLAYLSDMAYRYFVKLEKVPEEAFNVLGDFLLDNRSMPQVCQIAYLKYCSQHLSEEIKDSKKSLLQEILDGLCRDLIYFEFYQEYKNVLNVPYNAIDKTVVEYRAQPNARVQIFYRYSENEEFQSEVLKCVAGGVYTKSFICFFGDSIQYYFEEENGATTVKTEVNTCFCATVSVHGPEGRFDSLNDMLVSLEMHDMATLKKLMQEYCIQNYVSQQIFKPL